MRSLIAYLLALLAVSAGVWFGFFSRSAAGADEERRPAAVPVILAPVVEAPFSDTLTALGTAIANESVRLTANRSDIVRSVHFEDGDEVAAGDLLVQLTIAEEEAMLTEAKALLLERRTAHARTVELHEKGIAPESEVQTALAQLDAARARVETLEATIADHSVRAPFAGRLGLRQVSVGTLLQPSAVIATLDDLSVIKVDFTIPETWLSAVRVGQPIVSRTDAWPNETFLGKIAAVDTRLDPRTRSATVRALVPNADRRLRPGMLMKVSVDRGEAPSLQVPEEALVQKGSRHYVYVVDADSVAHETDVTIGRRRVGRVEVLGGVTAGQRVVVQGLVRVRDGLRVEVVAVRNGGA